MIGRGRAAAGAVPRRAAPSVAPHRGTSATLSLHHPSGGPTGLAGPDGPFRLSPPCATLTKDTGAIARPGLQGGPARIVARGVNHCRRRSAVRSRLGPAAPEQACTKHGDEPPRQRGVHKEPGADDERSAVREALTEVQREQGQGPRKGAEDRRGQKCVLLARTQRGGGKGQGDGRAGRRQPPGKAVPARRWMGKHCRHSERPRGTAPENSGTLRAPFGGCRESATASEPGGRSGRSACPIRRSNTPGCPFLAPVTPGSLPPMAIIPPRPRLGAGAPRHTATLALSARVLGRLFIARAATPGSCLLLRSGRDRRIGSRAFLASHARLAGSRCRGR